MTSSSCPIVGIGASAGGLAALKTLFQHLPVDSGAAFVVIQHLDPKHESLTAEILARSTAMPAVQVTNGMLAQANHVYVIPPNAYLTLRGHTLALGEAVLVHGLRMPIDTFFWSLAEQHETRAIAVILSGTGSDGTLGMRAIKGGGGLTMAQSPATAQYDGMPRSAIATGMVDVVCPIDAMAQRLAAYLQHPYLNGATSNAAVAPSDADDSHQLHAILAVVQTRTGHDFRAYKQVTLRRRIGRRMGLNLLQNLDEYVAFLGKQADEVLLLFNDLLIGVTAFFRDPDAWQALDVEVIVPLVERRHTDEPIRVWVPGCASGEEAYSIAIVLLERLSAAGKHCPIQIFATDVDEASLAVARAGVYPENIAVQLTPKRLQRYFDKEDHCYRIKPALRATVTFATQDMLSDPPFSNLDLISCRNLLIYLKPDVQQKVFALFHFAMRDAGCLFLGHSETANQHNQLFVPVAKKWRIYRRLAVSDAPFSGYPSGSRRAFSAAKDALTSAHPAERIRLGELAQRHLVEDYAPAAVLINRNHQVLNFSGPTTRFLQQPSGAPTHDLLAMARPELRPGLRTALRQVMQATSKVTLDDAHVMRGSERVHVKITLKPLTVPRLADSLYLITFEDDNAPPAPPEPKKRITAAPDQQVIQQLETELGSTREELQSNIEDQESANEELQAANEEVMSVNEELQSSNEELETSKEELQSMNEELTTVNSQLKDKVDELTSSTNDLANLLSSTDIATLFLDTEFRIGRFTPATQRLFKLISSDVGRPIDDIRQKFSGLDWLDDARQVLTTLVPLEREVHTEDGACFLLRSVPYRTEDNRTTGVVITFVDITQRKQAEEDAQRLASLVRDSNDAIILQDLEGKIIAWNSGADRIYGWSEQEALGMPFRNLIPDASLTEYQHLFERTLVGERLPRVEMQRISKDGRQLDVSVTLTPLYDQAGAVNAIASTEQRDVTARNQAEATIRASQALADAAYAAKSRVLSTASHDLRQPLQSLSLLNASLLETVTDPDAREMLAMQGDSLAGMGRLLNSLLNISSLDSGSVGAVRDNVALQPILQQLNAEFKPTASAKALRLNIEPSDASVSTDADLLTQLLENLVANAVRYTQQGFVQVTCQRVDQRVKSAVTDSGVGIAADQLTAIFEEFHQVDRDPQQPYAGLGLGLAIVKRIADLLETNVDVQSELGRGSTFSLMLPVGEAEPAAAGVADVLPGEPVTDDAVILLVDDDPDILKATRLFVALGNAYEITTAASAPAALEVLQHITPDLIITDYHLGAGDTGMDIIRAARRRAGATIPAILVSGYTDSALQNIDDDNVHLLIKPLKAKKLSLLIRRLLQ